MKKLKEKVQNFSKIWVLILWGLFLSGCTGVESSPINQGYNSDSSNQASGFPAPTKVSGFQESPLPQPAAEIDPIQLAWFYKPPNENKAFYLAENYKIFILTKLDENFRDELIYSYGVSQTILRYIRFDAIMDPGSCLEQPYRNQVADEIGDFCTISSEHPDWFLLDKNGNRIVNDDGNYYLMDPGNQEWRTFWLERVKINQEKLGWEGLFLDNVEAGFSKRERLNSLPLKYKTVTEYQVAIRGFLEYIYDTYAAPAGQLVYANVLLEDEPAGLLSYLPYLDGVMVEGFAVDWKDGYRTPKEWNRQMELIEMIGNQGVEVILVAKGDEAVSDRLEFAFASYLLVTNGNTYFRFVLNERTNEIVQNEIYNLVLGQPLGERYLEGDTWIRVFEKGVVRVNPVTEIAEILMTQ